ncbi:hypothetical protein G7Y89_g9376 [Cudoniella acicularis]|uniref:Uncharacterized protein n=1 Tax=Cudoniella acicularis TaxID=354080 RepID=A0A8H4W039_9HELO|nr:hypothetical protein G7Y89_g9376 [Cudoniella acicularis]
MRGRTARPGPQALLEAMVLTQIVLKFVPATSHVRIMSVPTSRDQDTRINESANSPTATSGTRQFLQMAAAELKMGLLQPGNGRAVCQRAQQGALRKKHSPAGEMDLI